MNITCKLLGHKFKATREILEKIEPTFVTKTLVKSKCKRCNFKKEKIEFKYEMFNKNY